MRKKTPKRAKLKKANCLNRFHIKLKIYLQRHSQMCHPLFRTTFLRLLFLSFAFMIVFFLVSGCYLLLLFAIADSIFFFSWLLCIVVDINCHLVATAAFSIFTAVYKQGQHSSPSPAWCFSELKTWRNEGMCDAGGI